MVEIVDRDIVSPDDVLIQPLHEPRVDWTNTYEEVNEALRQHEWFEHDLQVWIGFSRLFPTLYKNTNGGQRLIANVSERYANWQVHLLVRALNERGWICSVHRSPSSRRLIIKHPKDKTITLWERLRRKMGYPWLLR